MDSDDDFDSFLSSKQQAALESSQKLESTPAQPAVTDVSPVQQQGVGEGLSGSAKAPFSAGVLHGGVDDFLGDVLGGGADPAESDAAAESNRPAGPCSTAAAFDDDEDSFADFAGPQPAAASLSSVADTPSAASPCPLPSETATQPEFLVGEVPNVGHFCVKAPSAAPSESGGSEGASLNPSTSGAEGGVLGLPSTADCSSTAAPTETLGAASNRPAPASSVGGGTAFDDDDDFADFAGPQPTQTSSEAHSPGPLSEAATQPEFLVGEVPNVGHFCVKAPSAAPSESGGSEGASLNPSTSGAEGGVPGLPSADCSSTAAPTETLGAASNRPAPASSVGGGTGFDDDDDFADFAGPQPTQTSSEAHSPGPLSEAATQPEFLVGEVPNVGHFCVKAPSAAPSESGGSEGASLNPSTSGAEGGVLGLPSTADCSSTAAPTETLGAASNRPAPASSVGGGTGFDDDDDFADFAGPQPTQTSSEAHSPGPLSEAATQPEFLVGEVPNVGHFCVKAPSAAPSESGGSDTRGGSDLYGSSSQATASATGPAPPASDTTKERLSPREKVSLSLTAAGSTAPGRPGCPSSRFAGQQTNRSTLLPSTPAGADDTADDDFADFSGPHHTQESSYGNSPCPLPSEAATQPEFLVGDLPGMGHFCVQAPSAAAADSSGSQSGAPSLDQSTTHAAISEGVASPRDTSHPSAGVAGDSADPQDVALSATVGLKVCPPTVGGGATLCVSGDASVAPSGVSNVSAAPSSSGVGGACPDNDNDDFADFAGPDVSHQSSCLSDTPCPLPSEAATQPEFLVGEVPGMGHFCVKAPSAAPSESGGSCAGKAEDGSGVGDPAELQQSGSREGGGGGGGGGGLKASLLGPPGGSGARAVSDVTAAPSSAAAGSTIGEGLGDDFFSASLASASPPAAQGLDGGGAGVTTPSEAATQPEFLVGEVPNVGHFCVKAPSAAPSESGGSGRGSATEGLSLSPRSRVDQAAQSTSSVGGVPGLPSADCSSTAAPTETLGAASNRPAPASSVGGGTGFDDDDDFADFAGPQPTQTSSEAHSPGPLSEAATQPEFLVGEVPNVGHFCVKAPSAAPSESGGSEGASLNPSTSGAEGGVLGLPSAADCSSTAAPTETLGAASNRPAPASSVGGGTGFDDDDDFADFAGPQPTQTSSEAHSPGPLSEAATQPEFLVGEVPNVGHFCVKAPSAAPSESGGSEQPSYVAATATHSDIDSTAAATTGSPRAAAARSSPSPSPTPSSSPTPATPAEQPQFRVGVIEHVGRYCVPAASPLVAECSSDDDPPPSAGDASPELGSTTGATGTAAALHADPASPPTGSPAPPASVATQAGSDAPASLPPGDGCASTASPTHSLPHSPSGGDRGTPAAASQPDFCFGEIESMGRYCVPAASPAMAEDGGSLLSPSPTAGTTREAGRDGDDDFADFIGASSAAPPPPPSSADFMGTAMGLGGNPPQQQQRQQPPATVTSFSGSSAASSSGRAPVGQALPTSPAELKGITRTWSASVGEGSPQALQQQQMGSMSFSNLGSGCSFGESPQEVAAVAAAAVPAAAGSSSAAAQGGAGWGGATGSSRSDSPRDRVESPGGCLVTLSRGPPGHTAHHLGTNRGSIDSLAGHLAPAPPAGAGAPPASLTPIEGILATGKGGGAVTLPKGTPSGVAAQPAAIGSPNKAFRAVVQQQAGKQVISPDDDDMFGELSRAPQPVRSDAGREQSPLGEVVRPAAPAPPAPTPPAGFDAFDSSEFADFAAAPQAGQATSSAGADAAAAAVPPAGGDALASRGRPRTQGGGGGGVAVPPATSAAPDFGEFSGWGGGGGGGGGGDSEAPPPAPGDALFGFGTPQQKKPIQQQQVLPAAAVPPVAPHAEAAVPPLEQGVAAAYGSLDHTRYIASLVKSLASGANPGS